MKLAKQKSPVLLTVLLLKLITSNIGHAQPSSVNSISFQGALTGAGGQRLADGNYNLTFKFYDVPTGGTALATSNVPNVPVTGGITTMSFPVDPEWLRTDFGSYGPSRYLGVAINAGGEMSPRVMLTALPYAMSFSGHRIDLIGTNNLSIRFLEGADPNGFWTLQTSAWADGNFGIVRRDPQPNPNESIIITPDGSVGIGTYLPSAKLDVRGTVRMAVCQITGGADLAEHLSVSDANRRDEFKVAPGMVVSIDPSGNRKFKLSDEPYDRKRVGIISGGHGVKPGLVLRDEGNPEADGEQPIALTGQVWCRADTAFGPITPGDLITTSGTPGHAMKVSDDAKARFAVLGQALTGLKEGRGWVQVLVGKQ